jgi:hypothetical protein
MLSLSTMNKIIFIFFGLILFCSLNVTNVMAQNTTANAGVFAIVVNTSLKSSPQINYISDLSQTVQTNSAVPEKSFQISADNVKQAGAISQNIASFSITYEKQSSFSLSLPSSPILLTNIKNGNTIQVSGWKSDSQTGQGGSQKNVKVINLDASLKMGSASGDKTGEYIGTYPVTFVYN